VILKMKKIKSEIFRRLKNRLFAGILVLIPIFVSLWLAGFLYVKLSNWAIIIVERFVPELDKLFWIKQSVRVGTLLLIIVVLLLIGESMRYKLGRLMARFTEWVLLKVPILRSVYVTSRQIGEALLTPKGNMFSKVVLIEYPRKGIYTLGFLTNENKKDWELSEKTNKQLLSIFIPTTPNPTSGFLLFVPCEECQILDMKVSEGMKLVISGGVGTHNN
jgi:uncharacterized membrane protein